MYGASFLIESETNHYIGHNVPYSLQRVCGFFNVPQIFYYMCKGLWDGAYGLSSLSEKTRKSNHLQMLLQRQHFLLSYLKTLSVGRSADRRLSHWANRAAVSHCLTKLRLNPFSLRATVACNHYLSWTAQEGIKSRIEEHFSALKNSFINR